METHKYKFTGDHRSQGQTLFEMNHTTACGYVRDSVTEIDRLVTCKICRNEMAKPPTQ